ncbi:single-stranded DNA-binding protein [Listeria monocytogenes]|uniref:single-stranded DNA-binding protein n=1 Tax=Listeria monocytogenes TaxID=1639 RepID=UPI0007757E27|nr:single-stranded DNA-binding protein [Listeria monocytogenes]EAD0725604.1 single-stranded DNA-binding protein [Listeria monocytogenes]EAD6491152.1 single-stranded DNA-binding protein [Listeria monocytogenes]EAE6702416.1 single-stranded DNA-binding protein [Listeria monocytogenes]EAF6599574.1 single-stranded DNA-binding protein [Listeria monocytogenes]EAG9428296.1 single-stranded DNA-binding protein [Listeria monocytogenes]
MINRVVLVGRLTKNPELRYTPSGVAVATFTLAVNRTFANQQGEREADFINCVVWRKPAENVANFLKKGSMAGVEGRVQTRNYEGNDGKRVYVTEIVAENVQFLEPRNSHGANNPMPDESYAPPERASADDNRQDADPFMAKALPVADETVPF